MRSRDCDSEIKAGTEVGLKKKKWKKRGKFFNERGFTDF